MPLVLRHRIREQIPAAVPGLVPIRVVDALPPRFEQAAARGGEIVEAPPPFPLRLEPPLGRHPRQDRAHRGLGEPERLEERDQAAYPHGAPAIEQIVTEEGEDEILWSLHAASIYS